MRKLLLICMIVLLAIPTVFAARKKDKAGEVVDYVYTDNTYKFSLTLNEEWKYKIQKENSSLRMSLNQINYAIPPDYASIPDYTKHDQLLDKVKELVQDRKNWVLYALSNEAKVFKTKRVIIQALAVPERSWTKEKILAILQQALEE